jgi:hypothetical protein
LKAEKQYGDVNAYVTLQGSKNISFIYVSCVILMQWLGYQYVGLIIGTLVCVLIRWLGYRYVGLSIDTLG